MKWTVREFVVGNRSVRLRVPADPDTLLDDVTDRSGVDQPEPYWAAVWPAACEMATFLTIRNWPDGMRAVELGCGVGLVGVAGLVAGLDVLFTDNAPEAVRASVDNARRNGFPKAHGRLIDWRKPQEIGRFPLVLAADVLYDRELHLPLLTTIDRLLLPHGDAWLGEPGRSVAVEFVERCPGLGFRVTIHDGTCLDGAGKRDGKPTDEPALNRSQFRLLHLERERDVRHSRRGE